MSLLTYLNQPFAPINRLLGINGKLAEGINSNFSLSDGKKNLLLATSALALPPLQNFVYDKLNLSNVANAPNKALDDSEPTDFDKKIFISEALNSTLNASQIGQTYINSIIDKNLENTLFNKFFELHRSNGGLTNVYLCENPEDLDQLKKLYAEDIRQFFHDYMNCTFNLVYSITTLVSRSLSIYKSVKQLLTDSSNSNIRLKILYVIGTVVVVELVAKYLSAQSDKLYKKYNEYNKDLTSQLSYIVDSDGSKRLISDNETRARFGKFVNDTTDHYYYDYVKQANLLSIGQNIISNTKSASSLFVIGKLFINQKKTSSQYADFINDVHSALNPFYSIVDIADNISHLKESSKKLEDMLTKLEMTKALAEKQIAKIKRCKESMVSIKNMRIEVGEKKAQEEGGSKDIHKTSHDLTIDIESFEAKAGQVIGLIGESRAGKSSFFKALAYGIGIADNNSRAQKIECGHVYQMILTNNLLDFNKDLYSNLTETGSSITKEIVQEQLGAVGLIKDEDKNIFYDMIKDDSNKSYSLGLSGGEKFRLALIRAVNSSAKIIEIDQGFGELDVENDKKTKEFVKKMAKDHGKIFIVIDHEYLKIGKDDNFYDQTYKVERKGSNSTIKKYNRTTGSSLNL